MQSAYGGRSAGGAMAGGAMGGGAMYSGAQQGEARACGMAAAGEEITACGVGCGGGGEGALSYVGTGQGEYIQETTYKYVGQGGDFARPQRNFTCIIASGVILSVLLLIPLICWLLDPGATTLPVDCNEGMQNLWPAEKAEFCCESFGLGCLTTALPETTPTVPPTPFPTMPPTPPPTMPPTLPPTFFPNAPPGPVDPFNCAVGEYSMWAADKQQWCCQHHHTCGQPTVQPAPADPYNCADGFANWLAGWSVAKKQWCCRVHGKGCPGQGGGCVTSSEPYDCDAGFANWMAGWSIAKKAWCCSNKGKGCPPAAGGCN